VYGYTRKPVADLEILRRGFQFAEIVSKDKKNSQFSIQDLVVSLRSKKLHQ